MAIKYDSCLSIHWLFCSLHAYFHSRLCLLVCLSSEAPKKALQEPVIQLLDFFIIAIIFTYFSVDYPTYKLWLSYKSYIVILKSRWECWTPFSFDTSCWSLIWLNVKVQLVFSLPVCCSSFHESADSMTSCSAWYFVWLVVWPFTI